MKKNLICLLVVFLSCISTLAIDLNGRTFYVYNTTRAGDGNSLPSGTRLYWTANADNAYLTTTKVEGDENMLWEFVETTGGVYIRNVGRGKLLAAIQAGGSNVALSAPGAVYSVNEGSGTYAGAYSFNSGSNRGNYLFADNPTSGGTQYRLDGWSNSQHEYFYLEEYIDPDLTDYVVSVTGNDEGGIIYRSKTYKNGETFKAKNLSADDCSALKIKHYDADLSLTDNTVSVVYTAWQEYSVQTPFAEMGTVLNVNNRFTAHAAEGYVFDYWSDGQQTYDEAELTYEGETPVRMTAFFRTARDKSKPQPPTMGWSSWNTYHALISADNIASQADALVKTGLAKKGYNYVNIDDGFQKNRDAAGYLVTDDTRFPDGLQPVVDHIHAKGLKAGIYSDAGSNTCASMYAGETGGKGAGLYEHEAEDCNLYFNQQKFDFIKVDYCGAGDQNLNPQQRYTSIKNSIDATGRDVQYNLCRWAYPGTWCAEISNSWRTTGDIWSYWSKDQGASYSVKTIIKENLYLSAYSSPGHYNDMDMLEVGVNRDGGQLSEQESKTHFGMWCIMNSPLLIGCDVNSISESDLQILGNEELIAVNQDPVFQQAYVVKNDNGAYILVKDLEEANGLVRAVALYNPTDATRSMTLTFADIDLAGTCSIRNLTDHIDLGEFEEMFTTQIPAHGAIIYKVTATERKIRTIYEAETAYCTAYNEVAEAVGAVITEDSNCSGGIKIGWLGKTKENAFGQTISNDLIWKNVYVPEDCTVQIDIAFISGENRTINLMVNEEDITTLTCHSGNWSTVGKISTTISLKAGNNEIRLYNDDNYMPDIDLMTISNIVPTTISTIKRTNKDEARRYDLSGRTVSENYKGVSIKNGVKTLK